MTRRSALLLAKPGRTNIDQWALDDDMFWIGRGEQCALVLHLPQISRQHVAIRRIGDGYEIIDGGSRNGTFVNGERLGQAPRRLVGGDEIVVGGAASYIFSDPDETIDGPRIGRLQGLWLDDDQRDVWIDMLQLDPPLSAAQFTLMSALYQANGNIVTRDDIIALVWPDSDPSGVSGEAIDGLIKRLRQRLRSAAEHEYVVVVRGHGLRFIQRNDS